MPAATDDGRGLQPALTVSMPTFNNRPVLQRALESWERFGGPRVEVVVVEDGCRDDTPAYLDRVAATPWGRRHLRWIHQDDAHELRCTNAGFAEACAPLMLAWQDDMFLERAWFVPELLATFDAYPELGLLSLSRGLNCVPFDGAIEDCEDLLDWRRLQSTIGPAPWNWFRLQEVDIVIRPWAVRREAWARVGPLDEAFRPTEWDEADLACRLRQAGWPVATCGFERLRAYTHLGSTTLRHAPPGYRAQVLRNGRLFHERWGATIAREHPRARRHWRRRATPAGWMATLSRMAGRAFERAAGGRPAGS